METKNNSFKDYFTWRGRLNRRPYFLRYFSYLIVNLILKEILMNSFYGTNDIFKSTRIIFIILAIVASIFMLMQIIRRLHDLNKSGWYVSLVILLYYIIPFFDWLIVLFFYLYLFLAKGTNGSNRFGPNPLDKTYRNHQSEHHQEQTSFAQSKTIDAEYTEIKSENVEEKEEDK